MPTVAKTAGMARRQGDGIVVRLHAAAGADGHHPGHAGGQRPRDDRFAICIEARLVKVAV